MTFSLTDDGQEGHYFELLAKLCPAAGAIQVLSDVRVNKFEKHLSFSLKSWGEWKIKHARRAENVKGVEGRSRGREERRVEEYK